MYLRLVIWDLFCSALGGGNPALLPSGKSLENTEKTMSKLQRLEGVYF